MNSITGEQRRLTYADMYRDANQMAERLQQNAFRRRFLAVIWMEQSPECFKAFMSVLLAGGIPVPLHPTYKWEEVLAVVHKVEAEAVLLSRSYWDSPVKPSSSAGQISFPQTCFIDGESGERFEDIPNLRPVEFRRSYVPPDETAVIFMSSGSTGTPKGIMLSERNLLSNVSSIQGYLHLTDEDRVLVSKSFGYCSTITSEWLLALLTGAQIIMSAGFFHPLYTVAFIREHRATFICTVPSALLPLLKTSKWEHSDLRSLKKMIIVGGGMPPEMLLKLQQDLPWTQVIPCYGLTEAAPRVTYLPAHSLEYKSNSVGIPISEVHVDIYREEQPVGIGEIGELVVRGPNVMLGYYNDLERTNAVKTPYGLRTSDAGYKDSEGFLFITGRIDNAINVAGHTLYPEMIERVISIHSSVQEAAVVGRPDEVWGQLPVAYVVLKEKSISAESAIDEIYRYCQEHLNSVQRPKNIIVIPELPKTKSGKLDRVQLIAVAKEL